MSQKWPLSQAANKASGVCPCCKAVRQLHLRDGTLQLHGPRSQRCPGSGLKPLQPDGTPAQSASQPCSSTMNSHSPAAFLLTTQSNGQPPASQRTCPINLPSTASTDFHQEVRKPTIKHIPKPARAASARELTAIFNSVVSRPETAANWQEVLDFGHDIPMPHQRRKTGKLGFCHT